MKKLLLFLVLTISTTTFAASLEGINFADTTTLDGKNLILNGIGIRKATFLKIKVYFGALYLEAKSKDYNQFVNSNSPKQLVMHFVREVDAKKIKETFTEGFEGANKNHASMAAHLSKFLEQIPDLNKGDVLTINFHADGVTPVVKAKALNKVGNAEFSHALLNIWFTNPKDEGLRAGLLGQ